MRQFNSYQLLFLIPGIALVAASLYIPLSYLHKQLFWTETEALITERVGRNEGAEVEVIYLMDFTDKQGIVHHIQAGVENTFIEGRDSEHIRIYYDHSNPADYELFNPGNYLLILFLPFGLLCSYLGWPEKASSKKIWY